MSDDLVAAFQAKLPTASTSDLRTMVQLLGDRMAALGQGLTVTALPSDVQQYLAFAGVLLLVADRLAKKD